MADSPATVAAGWFPALTALLGFVASSIIEWLRDQRTSKRDREARSALRKAQLAERRANFQRETLINLQEAITAFTRTTGKIHHAEDMEFKNSGTWGKVLLPEELSENALEQNVRVMMLNSRVRDDQARGLIESFRGYANQIGILPSPAATNEVSAKMISTLQPIHERIGEILRKLDDDEESVQ